MDWVPRQELFIATAPGLEPVAAGELTALGIEGHREPGGVVCRGSLGDAIRLNVRLRAATRVLLRIGAFDAPGRRELAARAARLPLDTFMARGAAMHVRASSRKSRLYHTGLIAEVIHAALDRPAAPRDSQAPELFVRLDQDRCTVSIDTSGELLHRRGYRAENAQAPLRETLAAGMLLLAGYSGQEPLVDPMCGSGTIPIEAWLIATRRAPGLGRRFAFEAFPGFDRGMLDRIRDEAREDIRAPAAPIEGSDIHAGTLAAARRNAERAGATSIRFERTSVARRQAPASAGLLVTNPPYGRRLEATSDACAGLAAALDGPFASWRAAILLPRQARLQTRRTPARETPLDNGGIPVSLLEYRAP